MRTVWGYVVSAVLGVIVCLSTEASSQSKRSMKFLNQTDEALSLTLEASCLPTYGATATHLVQPGRGVLLAYDPTVANCVLLVPDKKNLGVQTSLFVLEPKSQQPDLTDSEPTCRVAIVKTHDRHHTYDLSSTCIRVLAKGH